MLDGFSTKKDLHIRAVAPNGTVTVQCLVVRMGETDVEESPVDASLAVASLALALLARGRRG